VDMATYKSEFLSHYYRGRLRPRAAYAMGLVPWWARLASRAPAAANFLTHGPGVAAAAKFAAGVAREREVPRMAGQTLRGRLRRSLAELGPQLDAGVPVVGLEPSCVAVFRDELVNLFPDDLRARRLAELTHTLGQLLLARARHFALPALHGRALVLGHCHH